MTGGKAGNRGGTPGWFRAKLRELGSHPRTLGYIEECLAGEHGPVAALAAWGHCLRFGLGDASKIEFSGRLASIDMRLLPNDVIEALTVPGANTALILRNYLTGALPAGRDEADEDPDADEVEP